MNVAVIPARGGSVRVPRKNVREFGGKPMIVHSIECALRSRIFGRIIVSTDDNEIAEVSVSHGAEVPFRRPTEISGDRVGLIPVVAHATAWLQDTGVKLDAVCCILATAPFIREKDVITGLNILNSGKWRYVFAATSYAYPIFRSFSQRQDGGLEMFFPEHFGTLSQDLPEAMHDAAQFYWARPEAWLEGATIFDDHSTVLPIPRWRVQDIDSPEDWERAEAMSRSMKAVP